MFQWNSLLREASDKIGLEHSPGPKLEGWIKKAGFVNVVSQVFKLPLGPWPKEQEQKDIGMWNMSQMQAGAEAFTLHLLCEVLGWTKEDVTALLTKVRGDFRSPKIHAYYN